MKGNFTWKPYVLLGKLWFHPEIFPSTNPNIWNFNLDGVRRNVHQPSPGHHHYLVGAMWKPFPVGGNNDICFTICFTHILEVLPSVLPTKNGKSINIAIQMWLFYILHRVLPTKNHGKSGKIRKNRHPWRNHRFQTSAAWPGCVEMVPRGHCSVPFQSSTAE